MAGTYDAVLPRRALYAATDAYRYTPKCVDDVVGWNGASDLEDLFLGRGRFKGQDTDYWYGDLRGIRVYSGVLDEQHINASSSTIRNPPPASPRSQNWAGLSCAEVPDGPGWAGPQVTAAVLAIVMLASGGRPSPRR